MHSLFHLKKKTIYLVLTSHLTGGILTKLKNVTNLLNDPRTEGTNVMGKDNEFARTMN